MVDIIKEVVKRLEDAGIAYMFTGATALNFYAVPRMTRDVDIVIELYRKDIRTSSSTTTLNIAWARN